MEGAPHVFVTDLSALCSALEGLGERVVTRHGITAVVKMVGGHESTIQLVWAPAQGAIFLVEVLPMLIAPTKVEELIRALAFANAQIASPAFQLRKQPAGWKVAYSVCVYLDHEGKLSTRVVVEWLAEIRRVIQERLPELASFGSVSVPPASPAIMPTTSEFVDSVNRATKKLEQIKLATHPALTPAELAQLDDVFRRDLPRFGDRASASKISDAGAQYFDRVRILRLASAAPFPAQTAYAAWLSTGPVVLSHHPSALAAVNAEEISARASDPDLAVALAGIAGVWVGASLMLEVRLNSVNDIPFRGATDEDRASEADIRQRFATQIVPPAVERLGNGVRLTMWIVSESQLRRRSSEIRGGAIAVTEEVLAEVPAFPGKMWATKNNRFVPVG
jgi:hypothetical protein